MLIEQVSPQAAQGLYPFVMIAGSSGDKLRNMEQLGNRGFIMSEFIKHQLLVLATQD